MKRSEIVKKYTETFGKRPTLQKDDSLTTEELFKLKQENKIDRFIWSLKKEIFTEYIEKSQEDDSIKVSSAKEFLEKFDKTDFLKIYHGYQYKLNIQDKTYSLFQD